MIKTWIIRPLKDNKKLCQEWKDIRTVVKAHKKSGLFLKNINSLYYWYKEHGGKKQLNIERLKRYVK